MIPKVNTEKKFNFFGDLHSAAEKCIVTSFAKSSPSQLLELRDGLTLGIELIQQRKKTGKKLIFVGNGGSAAICSHLAVDFLKNGEMEAMAFNDGSLLTCIGNDLGYERVFAEPIHRFAKFGDLVVAISSSGKSPNILEAAKAAKEKQCELMTLSGFASTNPLRSKGILNFYIPSDSYGIVEVSHLAILHAMLSEILSLSEGTSC